VVEVCFTFMCMARTLIYSPLPMYHRSDFDVVIYNTCYVMILYPIWLYFMFMSYCYFPSRFSPEMLGIQASSALGWLILELMVFTGSTYVIQTDLKFFDLMAFCGYKYVGWVLSFCFYLKNTSLLVCMLINTSYILGTDCWCCYCYLVLLRCVFGSYVTEIFEIF